MTPWQTVVLAILCATLVPLGTVLIAWGGIRTQVERLITSVDRLTEQLGGHSDRLTRVEARVDGLGGHK